MELSCWDNLRVTRDVCSASARDNCPARFHPVMASESNGTTKHEDPESFSPGKRIARIAASITK